MRLRIVLRPVTSLVKRREEMGVEIVTCDACGTKNRIDLDKADVSRCGRCQNPLLDAAAAAFPEFVGDEEEPERADEEDDDEEDDDEEDDHGIDMSARPICPEVSFNLVGEDGNAFAILGRAKRAMKDAGIPKEVMDKFTAEAMSGDYDFLLETCIKWFNV